MHLRTRRIYEIFHIPEQYLDYAKRSDKKFNHEGASNKSPLTQGRVRRRKREEN
jgi:hypothetical protein